MTETLTHILDPKELVIVSFVGEYSFMHPSFPCKVTFENQQFPNAYYAYEASRLWDRQLRFRLSKLPNGRVVEEFVRKLKSNHFQALSDSQKIANMWQILLSKFSKPTMAIALLNTGTLKIFAGSASDQFWGVTRVSKDKPELAGQNHLGELLMTLRLQMQLRTNQPIAI